MTKDQESDRPAVLWRGEGPFECSGGTVAMRTARVVRRARGTWRTPPMLVVELLYRDEMGDPRWSMADDRERVVVLDAAVRDLSAALESHREQDA